MRSPTQVKTDYVEGLREALMVAPRDPMLWTQIADVLLETGRFEVAVRAYDVALLFDRDFHRARIGLAMALEACDSDLSEREAPGLRGTAWEAFRAIGAVVEALKEGRPGVFVDVDAIRLKHQVDRRLALNPNDPDALFMRSAFLAKQGAFEDAIACLDRLSDRDPESPGASEFRRQLAEMARAAHLPPFEEGSVPRS